MLVKAVRCHHAGQLAEAERHYRQVLERQPDSADALHLLGLLGLQTGRYEAAAELIGQAIALGVDDADPYNNRGEALRALGRLDDAAADYLKALELQPQDAGVHYNLGLARMAMGDPGAALACFRRAVELAPDDTAAHNSLGIALIELDEPREAIDHFRRAAAADPEMAEAHGNLGAALVQLGEFPEAEAHFGKALAIDPAFVEAHLGRGRLHWRQGRLADAAAGFKRAFELISAAPAERPLLEAALAELGHLASAMAEAGDHDAAAPLFHLILRYEPEHVLAVYWSGVHWQAKGRLAEAEASFARAVAIDPDFTAAHLRLAALRKGRADEAEIRRIEELMGRDSLFDEDRLQLGFALAELCDDAGRYGDAFDHCAAANEMRRNTVDFDIADYEAYYADLRESFSPALLAEKRGIGTASELPVFIVGLPRSGRSLVERLLAGHPGVAAGGELPDLGHAVQALPDAMGTADPYPACIAALDGDVAGRIADAYLERLREISADALRVTDSLSNNFQRLGFIALVLPGARIIHCRREPLDTCLDCFFRNFPEGQRFTYDMAELGAYYRLYRELMDHWQAVLPGAILDVDCAALTADPEAEARRLLDFCGLDWDPGCRLPDQDPAGHARAPLFPPGHWRHYQEHLGPLIEALGPYGPRG